MLGIREKWTINCVRIFNLNFAAIGLRREVVICSLLLWRWSSTWSIIICTISKLKAQGAVSMRCSLIYDITSLFFVWSQEQVTTAKEDYNFIKKKSKRDFLLTAFKSFRVSAEKKGAHHATLIMCIKTERMIAVVVRKLSLCILCRPAVDHGHFGILFPFLWWFITRKLLGFTQQPPQEA